MKFLSYACLFPLAALWTPCASAEGGNGSLDFEQRINGKVVLKTIEPVRARLQDLSAVFFARHDVVAYGVILTPDGYIATKASEFESHKGLLIRIGSSKYESFQVVGTDPATDIALVKVDAAGLPAPGPVSSDVPLGTLVVSNGSTTRISRRPQLGTISAARRPIPNKDTVYLGVVFGESCSFQEVVKDGPAFQAGALAGDRIVALDGTPVSTLEDISPILRKKPSEKNSSCASGARTGKFPTPSRWVPVARRWGTRFRKRPTTKSAAGSTNGATIFRWFSSTTLPPGLR